jgi:mono/diheme cytochrome c family protein
MWQILFSYFQLACSNNTTNNTNNTNQTTPVTNNTPASEGETLFNQQCTQCHSAGEDRRIGPGLKNIKDRLPQPAEAYFLNYVRNNEKVYQSGDAYAIKVRNDYNGLLMPAFENVLSDEQIKSIYEYLGQ